MKARRVKGLDCDGGLADNARRIVLVRLDELFSFDPAVRDPRAVEQLHDMRIAAKRLRYILELTEPALGEAARLGTKEAKGLQGLLGDIHDCDVMVPRVHEEVELLRAQDAAAVRASADSRAKDLEPEAVRRAPNLGRYRGLEALATYLTARREVLYARFITEWDRLQRGRFRERLERGLAEALAPPSSPAAENGTDPARRSTTAAEPAAA